MKKTRILFLCTGNACRSQMAEAFARELRGDAISAASAGVKPHPILAETVEVMKEVGIDVSRARSKHVDELRDRPFDYVVTLCGSAQESCPMFPGTTKVVHVGFDDPPSLAFGARTREEALGHYRRVRDEIRAFVMTLPESLATP
jgi:arsenate reductase